MKYQNPIIKGFNPDPSICRVGEDYFLVTSTFEYFPGIPVYHSKDLVNWELIGHCIDRPEQLDLNIVKPSGGIWAPTIRYHEGKFYVTATFSEKGNFIIHSSRPDGGYSMPVWVEMDGIDPSMFFENGEMYYSANDCGSRNYLGEGISIAKMNPNTGKLKDKITRIYDGTKGGWIEAPHIYHVGEYYYLFTAEGGSGWGHMITQARSKNIYGPYETCPHHPMLTNRNDTSKAVLESGHGDLIEDGNGNFYIVHLGIRPSNRNGSNLGRETFLMPVSHTDGWFYVEGDKTVLEVNGVGDAIQNGNFEFHPDFHQPIWEKHWMFLGIPSMENYERGNGELVLHGDAFVAVRQPDFSCKVTSEMVFEEAYVSNMDLSIMGLVVYLSPEFKYRIYVSQEVDGRYVIVDKQADDMKEIAYKEKVEASELIFNVTSDKSRYHFTYSLNGVQINAATASTKFLCTEFAGKCFTGTVIGVFSEGGRTKARVKSFHVQRGNKL